MDLESDPKYLSPIGKDVPAFLEAIHERLDLEQASVCSATWEFQASSARSGPERDSLDANDAWEPFAWDGVSVLWRRRVRSTP